MKTLKHTLILAAAALFIASCGKNQSNPEVKTVEVESSEVVQELDPNANYAKAEFTIEGMTCAIGCAKTIEGKIAKMDGVKSAKVDFDKKLAMVEYDEAKVSPMSLEETVKKTGDTYKVSEMKTVESFSTETGKTCKPGCTMPCCAKKDEVSKETASADMKTACKKDCKMACCAEKAKA